MQHPSMLGMFYQPRVIRAGTRRGDNSREALPVANASQTVTTMKRS
ncbi:MAG: hypothetical protein K8S99_17730 [Planctomycetes bacterium]|nr:hypothetical protein [Planctomycetota bacterium]